MSLIESVETIQAGDVIDIVFKQDSECRLRVVEFEINCIKAAVTDFVVLEKIMDADGCYPEAMPKPIELDVVQKYEITEQGYAEIVAMLVKQFTFTCSACKPEDVYYPEKSITDWSKI